MLGDKRHIERRERESEREGWESYTLGDRKRGGGRKERERERENERLSGWKGVCLVV